MCFIKKLIHFFIKRIHCIILYYILNNVFVRWKGCLRWTSRGLPFEKCWCREYTGVNSPLHVLLICRRLHLSVHSKCHRSQSHPQTKQTVIQSWNKCSHQGTLQYIKTHLFVCWGCLHLKKSGQANILLYHSCSCRFTSRSIPPILQHPSIPSSALAPLKAFPFLCFMFVSSFHPF